MITSLIEVNEIKCYIYNIFIILSQQSIDGALLFVLI